MARTRVDGWRAAGPFAADLSDHSGVLLAEQRGGWSLAGGGSRALWTMLVADDADFALALAASGAGIAQLPDFAGAEALAAGELRELLPGDAPPPARIAASVSADAARPALALLDHLAASLSGRR